MSLILDALRKSEAERRRGQAPDVFAATPGAPPTRAPAPRVWPLLLLGAMLLGSAWLIWQAGGERVNDPPATEEPADGADDAATPPPRIVVVPAPAPPPPTRPPRNADAARAAEAAVAVPAPTQGPMPAPPLPTPPTDTVVAEPELPPVAVLDAGARAALPPLKLTMHVYADDPARRFAIVDGQRVAEGARLGATVVAQIRRDGVVIEVDGRRLLLPKP
jgi:general secretion pathway protein B